MKHIGTDGGGYFGQPKGVKIVGLRKVEPTSFKELAEKRLAKMSKRAKASAEGLALLACLAVLR